CMPATRPLPRSSRVRPRRRESSRLRASTSASSPRRPRTPTTSTSRPINASTSRPSSRRDARTVRKLANSRIRLLLVLFVIAFAIVAARAVWLQGIRADALAGLAATQHHETITIPAGRGTIFDRLGVQLAIGEEARTVYADPRLVKNPRLVAAAAAKTFGVSAKALSPQLADKKRSFVYIA